MSGLARDSDLCYHYMYLGTCLVVEQTLVADPDSRQDKFGSVQMFGTVEPAVHRRLETVTHFLAAGLADI